jgi:protein ImuB
MTSPSRRYLSVWLRRLATDRLTRTCAAPADSALVVTAPVKNALRLVAVNDAAAALGLRCGMALADARAMYPALVAVEADAAADKRTLAAVADWCDRYTPLVGLDPPDGLLLDVTGCAHLFGGESSLCRDLVGRLGQQGFAARAALADTVGCAWAMARYGEEPIVQPRQRTEALAPLPLAALRLEPDVVDALARAGLKRIEDVLDRPRAPLAARFAGLIRRLDQVLGHEEESITPRLPPPSFVAERRFAGPIARETDVLATIAHLARELSRTLERHGQGARLLQAALFRTDGKVYRIDAGTSAPLREPTRIGKLFGERFAAIGEECDPGFGFDVVRLSVLTAERCEEVQTGFVAPHRRDDLSHLIDRLGARFGLRRVTRLVAQDTHLPEFAVAAMPISDDRGRRRENRPLSSVLRPPSFDQESLAPVRPIRLFARPEPIEAIAEVPDGPPVRFRWRRVLHEVSAVEGPERIAMEWWRDAEGRALTRDYFRVESAQGLRVWLYREGLYAREVAQPRWFLHGLFA